MALAGIQIDLENQDAVEEAVYKHLFETFYPSDTQVKESEIKSGYLKGKAIINKKIEPGKKRLVRTQ